jgi:hypothetical protein
LLLPVALIVAIVTSGTSVPPAPPPAPAPSGSPSITFSSGESGPLKETLKEIGRVTTNAMCTGIVMRANSAISAALRNDQTLTLAVATLRHVDLDTSNEIDKQRGMREIDKIAAELRKSAGDADGQVKKLREMSAQATDPVRKAELKSFADALGGALFKQNQIGNDLQRMVVIMDGRDARAQAHADMTGIMPQHSRLWQNADSKGVFDTHNYNQLASDAAKDVESRTLAISADESKAANHIVGAVNGC